MDFDKIKANAITEFEKKYPNLKNNDTSNPSINLARTISSIAAEMAIEMLKEYDRQQKKLS
ncbi:hypothetical protein [Anaerosinus sp.]